MHSKERMDEGEMSRKSIPGSWYSLGTEDSCETRAWQTFSVLEEATTLEEAMKETKWSQRAGRSLQFFSPHICSGRRGKARRMRVTQRETLTLSLCWTLSSITPFHSSDNPSSLGLSNNQELVKRMVISASKISA